MTRMTEVDDTKASLITSPFLSVSKLQCILRGLAAHRHSSYRIFHLSFFVLFSLIEKRSKNGNELYGNGKVLIFLNVRISNYISFAVI